MQVIFCVERARALVPLLHRFGTVAAPGVGVRHARDDGKDEDCDERNNDNCLHGRQERRHAAPAVGRDVEDVVERQKAAHEPQRCLGGGVVGNDERVRNGYFNEKKQRRHPEEDERHFDVRCAKENHGPVREKDANKRKFEELLHNILGGDDDDVICPSIVYTVKRGDGEEEVELAVGDTTLPPSPKGDHEFKVAKMGVAVRYYC